MRGASTPSDADHRSHPPVDHLVHFFDDDDGLVRTVSGYLTASVLDGDGVVIIATPEHRDLFRAELAPAGVDVEAAVASGRLQFVDAAETLASFTRGGAIDAGAFVSVIGDLIAVAAAAGHQVRAYGEMVSLLWADGDASGAIELERLWNGLGERLPFTLFCAYPAHLFETQAAAAAFGDVCHLHSDLVAGAPRPTATDVVRRFPRGPHAPRLARRFVAQVLDHWSLPPSTVDDALVVTSELVTNAMLHAASDVAVSLERRGDAVRIAVSDRSGRAPAARALGAHTLSGRGLAMIDALAQGWGHEVVDGGKLVWAEVAVADR